MTAQQRFAPHPVASASGLGRLALGLPIVALLAVGCEGPGMGDLDRYLREVLARPAQPIEPLPQLDPVDVFVYEPGDRRDPFLPEEGAAPEAIAIVEDDLAPDPTRRKEELESYTLDALRMVGTLQQEDIRWGLVRTRDGRLHRVSVGNYMGTNNGQIVQIDPDAIRLTEIVSDGPGRWRERPAVMSLTN